MIARFGRAAAAASHAARAAAVPARVAAQHEPKHREPGLSYRALPGSTSFPLSKLIDHSSGLVQRALVTFRDE